MSEADRLERDLEQNREHLRETLGAIEQKMSPGRLLDEAMAYFNTGPKAFASDLTTQIRDNPMPALLTGVGLAWLMMSDRKASAAPTGSSDAPLQTDGFGFSVAPADYDDWSEHDRLQQAEWSCIRLDDESAEAHARRLDQARAAALGIAYDPQEDQAGFSTRVRGAAETVKQKGASAREKLKQAAASAKHGAGSAASSGAHGLQSAASSAKSGAHAAVSSGLQFHESNPVATGAIGVALGALLGAALPLSRKEEAALSAVADKGMAVGAEISRKGSDAVLERMNQTGGDGGAAEPSASPDASRF
ncbi:MAG TPA: DUF3618 domain-containing protein [Brevundimonas sp.]|jgi:ElaB/YqjD/DUF883 family membrane-anchored ribosome-binding protein|uniref:DUF3618 domain-containing protein n=1 Tax=Brevundimonas sp. TaxID=1871086 RepID=UPI002ED7A7A0